MWIKICGNTNLEDAQLAASLGADALGFIFAPSKRHVTPAQVAAITPHLPPHIELIGVFQSQTAAEIVEILRLTGLTAVQIHDGATAPRPSTDPLNRDPGPDLFQLARQLHRDFGNRIRLIQSLHWNATPTPPAQRQPEASPPHLPQDVPRDTRQDLPHQIAALAQLPAAVDRLLIDSRVGSLTGGTGIPFDWQAARSALFKIPPHLKLILAGGLTPGNVSEAIRTLQPWGVDAVSGIEASPGRKDAKKLAAFIQHARA